MHESRNADVLRVPADRSGAGIMRGGLGEGLGTVGLCTGSSSFLPSRADAGHDGSAATPPSEGFFHARPAQGKVRTVSEEGTGAAGFPMLDEFDPHQIEARWQRVWEAEGTWEVSNDASGRDRAY